MTQWVHNLEPGITSQASTIIPVCVVLTVVATIATLLRCYVRMNMLKVFGADDWVIVSSTVCSIVYNALVIEQTRWGLGLDLKYRPHENAIRYSKVNFAGRPFYMLGITGFKVSLCLAYIRLVVKQRTYRRTTWWIMLSCVLTHLGGILVLIFQCKPVQKSWFPATPGKCLPNDITFYVLAANTILFDIAIIILPIPLFLRTQIPNRKKVVLIGLFALFSFTTICSVMRMVQIITITKSQNSTMLVLWGTIEMNIGITTTCIPTLSPLFKYFSERTQKASSLGYKSDSRGPRKTMELSFMGGSSETYNNGTSAYCSGTGQDNTSEESILAPLQDVHHGIQMKKDFQVEVSSSNSQ